MKGRLASQGRFALPVHKEIPCEYSVSPWATRFTASWLATVGSSGFKSVSVTLAGKYSAI